MTGQHGAGKLLRNYSYPPLAGGTEVAQLFVNYH